MMSKKKQRYPRKLKKQLIFETFEDGTKVPVMKRNKPYTRISKRELLRIDNAYKKQFALIK
jgi:hypothetical protein